MQYMRLTVVLFLALLFWVGCNKIDEDTTTVDAAPVKPVVTAAGCDTSFNAKIEQDPNFLIYVSPKNGAAPYTYKWSTGETTRSIVPHCDINFYAVTLTDSKGCTVAVSESIAEFIQVFFTQEDTKLTAGVWAGFPGYTYLWSTGSTSPTLPKVKSGDIYTVTVKDSRGCTAAGRHIVRCDSSLTVNISQNNATMQAVAAAGVPPYQYKWSTGATTPTIQLGTSGSNNHTVTVTDALNCTAVASASNTSRCSVQIGVDTMTAISIIYAIPLNATAPYQYKWSTGATTRSIPINWGSTYTITLTDARGCTATKSRVP